MDKEKLIKFIWGSVVVVFVTMFICSTLLETVKIYKLSNGTTISLETGLIPEIVLVFAAYYLSKHLISRDN